MVNVVSWPFFEKNYSSIPEDIVKIGAMLIEKLPLLYDYHHKQEVFTSFFDFFPSIFGFRDLCS